MEVSYSVEELRRFISKDRNPVIAFYGGEPLLKLDFIEEVIAKIEATYAIQTNGLLLHRLEPWLLKKFHSILVSIDGDEEITDRHRGRGVYRRIIENIRLIRRRGFKGDLIARMTVSRDADIYRDVTHLLGIPEFSHVHWQLDFEMFWKGNYGEKEREWLMNSYIPGVERLIELWIEEMERGKVLKMVPFLGIMYSLLLGEKTELRCGSGEYFFAIDTDGSIAYCPVVAEYGFARVGSIYSEPSKIRKVPLKQPCTTCDILDLCGGRCLFVNHHSEWAEFSEICKSVRHLIESLKKVKPKVENFIKNGVIKREDLKYPDVNVGCEIIP